MEMAAAVTYVKSVQVKDLDSGGMVEVEIFKHPNGGMFDLDSSYIEQVLDEERSTIPDIFGDYEKLIIS